MILKSAKISTYKNNQITEYCTPACLKCFECALTAQCAISSTLNRFAMNANNHEKLVTKEIATEDQMDEEELAC